MSNSINIEKCHKYINYLYIDSGKIKQYKGKWTIGAPARASIIELRDFVQSNGKMNIPLAKFINKKIEQVNNETRNFANSGCIGAILSWFGIIKDIDRINILQNQKTETSPLLAPTQTSGIEVVDEELKQLENQSSCIINVRSTEGSGARAIDVKKQLLQAISNSDYMQKTIDEISKNLVNNWSGKNNEKYYFSFDEQKQTLKMSCHEISDSSWSDAKSLLYKVTIKKKTN